MKTIQFLGFGLFLLVCACQKKTVLPESDVSDPVFYLNAKVNGNPISIQAGEAGYYMHSSVSQDSNAIYVFKGDLSGTCASSCGYSLSIAINDYKVSQRGGPLMVDSAIKPGTYNLLNKSAYPSTQVLSFTPQEAFSSANSYSWKVRDQKGEVFSSNSYSFATSLKLATQYTVTYQFEDASGACSGEHSNVYKPGNPFRAWVNLSKNGKQVSLSALTDVPGNYTYLWDYGDGSTGLGKEVQHTYPNQEKYKVKLTVTDAEKNVSVCFYEVNTNQAGCEANFVANYSPVDYSKILRNVAFILREPNGAVYSSQDATLLGGSVVEILTVEDFQRNAAGQATKKIKMRFSCRLKGDAGEVVIEDANAVMAVAY